MKKEILVLFLLMAGAILPVISAQEDKTICTLYFTYIGCPNCAICDPIVLTKWPEKYSNLVVIEYMWHGGDWQDPNSQFFGEFAKKYRTHSSVPKLVLSKNLIETGGINVPRAEKYIKTKESNPCPLIDKSISFARLNLGELKGNPKIWANGRILIKQGDDWIFQWNGEKISESLIGNESIDNELIKKLLFSDNISKILKGKKFEIVNPQRAEFSGTAFKPQDLLTIVQKIYPSDFLSEYYEYVPYVEFENAIKINLNKTEIVTGSEESEEEKESNGGEGNKIIEIPLFGKIKTGESSLLTLTIIFALADGLTNPCGFFVLFFLLAALLGFPGARKRMLVVGLIFVFFFALYYFLFMMVLLIIGREQTAIAALIGGLVCIFVGLLNVKDYFFFRKGISISLSKGKLSNLSEKIKNLSLAKSIPALIIGTTIIASSISFVAIGCTLGIPFAYITILGSKVPFFQELLYVIFYNFIYIIPMLIIILIFVITLGKKTFSKLWVRRLKLISGLMILFLGFTLLHNYTLLENASFVFNLIFLAIIISGIIILICKKIKYFEG